MASFHSNITPTIAIVVIVDDDDDVLVVVVVVFFVVVVLPFCMLSNVSELGRPGDRKKT